MAVALAELAGYLDEYLRIREVPDEPNAANGIQVENSGMVGWVVAAVDASQQTIDGVVAAAGEGGGGGSRQGPPLLLVHHGLFWDGSPSVTGRRYRRLKALLDRDVAVYAAHIPLDLHGEVGNNAVLARRLGLGDPEPFGSYRGIALGLCGVLEASREDLVARLDAMLGTTCRLLAGGPSRTQRVALITGGGGGWIGAARAAGADTFITGEGAHHTYFDAMEYGVNVIYAGHYATEQVGVQALAEHLAHRYGIPWEFHDHPTGL